MKVISAEMARFNAKETNDALQKIYNEIRYLSLQGFYSCLAKDKLCEFSITHLQENGFYVGPYDNDKDSSEVHFNHEISWDIK